MIDYKHWAKSLILSHWNFCCCFVSQTILQSLLVFISYVLAAPNLLTYLYTTMLWFLEQVNRKTTEMQQVQTVGPQEITGEGEISGGGVRLSPALRGTGPEQEMARPVCPTEDSRVDKAWTAQEHWGSSCQKRKRELLIWGNQGTAPSSSCCKPLKTNVTMSDQWEVTQIKRAGGKFSTSLAHTIDGWWMD